MVMALYLYECLTQCGGNEAECSRGGKPQEEKKLKEQRETVAAVTIAKPTGDWAISMKELGKNEQDQSSNVALAYFLIEYY